MKLLCKFQCLCKCKQCTLTILDTYYKLYAAVFWANIIK